MIDERNRGKNWDFPGGTVFVHNQNSKKVLAVEWDIIREEDLPSQDKFDVFHKIANIKVINRETESEELCFDPPLEFRVFHPYVWDEDGNDEVLKLAYKAKDKWVIVSEREEYEYEFFPETKMVKFKIWCWQEDPPIVWGK